MSLNISLEKIRFNIKPEILLELLNLDVDEKKSISELNKVLKTEPGMAALILKASNSQLYCGEKKISSINRAVTVLGTQMVCSLTMLFYSLEIFQMDRDSHFNEYIREHSLITALIAEDLSRLLPGKNGRDEFFLAGLLHDIGKLVLYAIDSKKYKKVINIIENDLASFAAAESAVFNTNHLEVGGELVESWNLPSAFTSVFSTHDDIQSLIKKNRYGKKDRLSFSVTIANYLANQHVGRFVQEPKNESKKLMSKVLSALDEKTDFLGVLYLNKIKRKTVHKYFMSILNASR